LLVKKLEDDIARTKIFLKGNKQNNKLEFEKLQDALKTADENIAAEKSNRQINENILKNKLSEARRDLKQITELSETQGNDLQSLTEQVFMLEKDNSNY